jgi:hypothetical protein
MWNPDSATVDKLFALSNLILIVGTTLALIGTIGSIFTSGVRDRLADQRIKHDESLTAVANQSAAEANEAAALARKELAVTQLKLEELRGAQKTTGDLVGEVQAQMAYRDLDQERLAKMTHELSRLQSPQPSVALYALDGDQETAAFRELLKPAFMKAKWLVYVPNIPPGHPVVGTRILGPKSHVFDVVTAAFKTAGLPFSHQATEPDYGSAAGVDGMGDCVVILGSKKPPLRGP